MIKRKRFGVINVITKQGSDPFGAAQEAGLNISSNLLTLAKIIDSGSRRGRN